MSAEPGEVAKIVSAIAAVVGNVIAYQALKVARAAQAKPLRGRAPAKTGQYIMWGALVLITAALWVPVYLTWNQTPPPARPEEIGAWLESNATEGPGYHAHITAGAVVAMVDDIRRRLEVLSPATFVVTAPFESRELQEDVNAILGAACSGAPQGRCVIQPPPDSFINIDTGIPEPAYAGVVIHSASTVGTDLLGPLGRCFRVRISSNVPTAIEKLRPEGAPPIVWVELGKGSPWRMPEAICG